MIYNSGIDYKRILSSRSELVVNIEPSDRYGSSTLNTPVQGTTDFYLVGYRAVCAPSLTNLTNFIKGFGSASLLIHDNNNKVLKSFTLGLNGVETSIVDMFFYDFETFSFKDIKEFVFEANYQIPANADDGLAVRFTFEAFYIPIRY